MRKCRALEDDGLAENGCSDRESGTDVGHTLMEIGFSAFLCHMYCGKEICLLIKTCCVK